MGQLGEAGPQKATATCGGTFEEVEKKTGIKWEKSWMCERDVCVVRDGGEKAMRSQKGSCCWMEKARPPVGRSFGLDLDPNTQFRFFWH